MIVPPTVETARLRLRVFDTESDLPAIAVALANPKVVRHLPGGNPRTRDQARAILAHAVTHWQTYDFGWWAVTDRSDDTVLGWCGLNHLKEVDEVEVLYLFDEPHWAKGYATEAARASIRFSG